MNYWIRTKVSVGQNHCQLRYSYSVWTPMLRGEWVAPTCRTQHWPIQQFKDVARVLTACIAMPHPLQKDSQHQSTRVDSSPCFICKSCFVWWTINWSYCPMLEVGKNTRWSSRNFKNFTNFEAAKSGTYPGSLWLICPWSETIWRQCHVPPRCHRRRGHRGCPSTQKPSANGCPKGLR